MKSPARCLSLQAAKPTLWTSRDTFGKSKWGLSKWGLKVLVHNCPRSPTIVVVLRREFPLEMGPKRPQKCTIVGDCAQIAESGLKLPFRLSRTFPPPNREIPVARPLLHYVCGPSQAKRRLYRTSRALQGRRYRSLGRRCGAIALLGVLS